MDSDGNRTRSDREPAAEPLNAFWNAVVRGAAPRRGDLEREFAETILQLHVAGSVPGLTASRQAQIWSELIAAWPDGSYPQTLPPLHQKSPNGRGAHGGSRNVGSLPPRRVRLVPQLATVALVLLTLLGSFVVFRGPLRQVSHEEQPAIIPAIDASATVPVSGTPTGERPASSMTDMILMQGTFTEIPRDASWAGLERATLQPGATRPLGKHENEGEGPMIYRVESGKLVINADGPIIITRAGETTSTTIPPRTDVVLGVDDEGFTPSGVTSLWRNEGSIPAVVLDAAITTFGAGPNPGGLVDSHGLNLVELVEQWPIPAPATPVTVTTHRLTLTPGDRIVPSQYRGLAGFYVVGGPLRVIDDPGSGSRPQTFDVRDGNGRVFGGSGYKSVPTTWTLENAGGDPISVLMLTITSGNSLEATPMS